MKNYQSLDNALSDLKKKGYEDDFTTTSFCLYCGDLDMRLDPADFHVDEADEVKDDSNPADEVTLYAISSSTGVKGTLIVDADGETREDLDIEISQSLTTT
jgi:hypothetical protein